MILDLDTKIFAPNGQPRKYYFDDYTRTYWIYQDGFPQQIDKLDLPEDPFELNDSNYHPHEATEKVNDEITRASQEYILGIENEVISYLSRSIETEARSATTETINITRSPDDWHYTNPQTAYQWKIEAKANRKDFLAKFPQYKDIPDLWNRLEENLKKSFEDSSIDSELLKSSIDSFKAELEDLWGLNDIKSEKTASRYINWKTEDGIKLGSEAKISYGDLKAINTDIWKFAVTSFNPFFKQREIMLFENREQAYMLTQSYNFIKEHQYVSILPVKNISAGFFKDKPVLLDLPQYSGCSDSGWMSNQKQLYYHWESLENPWKKIEILRDAKYSSFDSFDMNTFEDLYKTVYESRLNTYKDSNQSIVVYDFPKIGSAIALALQPFKGIDEKILNQKFEDSGIHSKQDMIDLCENWSKEVLEERKVVTPFVKTKVTRQNLLNKPIKNKRIEEEIER